MNMLENTTPVKGENEDRWIVWLIRSVIALNFIRFSLSFSSRFEGNASNVGLADHLFKWGNGFRADFVWLIVTTIVVFLAMFYFMLSWRVDSLRKFDALACFAWVLAFSVYIVRAFLTGIIDFG